jgi:hypothetical protein
VVTPAPGYRPRRSLDTLLHRVVGEHLDEFLRVTREQYDKPLPRYVVREFQEYLRCGDLSLGFVRTACPVCGHLLLVPFSCKRRGLCPSCAGRRMSNTAAHLTDRVLPNVPLRQWVLSLPFELRRLAAFRPDVVRAFSRLWAAAVFRHLRGGSSGVGRAGVVDFVQRAGGSLNLNVHLHLVALDGVFRAAHADGVAFRPAEPPTREELLGVLDDFRTRALRWLRRRGLLDEDGASAERSQCFDGFGALDACAQAAVQRGQFEQRGAGSGQAAAPEDDDLRFAARAPSRWSVELDGFNLHAGVRIAADDEEGRERLCRYGARPSFALGRLVEWPDGRIGYRVRWARSDAGPYRVMTPVEFLARLAALVPPPWYPLTRYHGVLAPASRWRPHVVPRPPGPDLRPAACPHGGTDRRRQAPLAFPLHQVPVCRASPEGEQVYSPVLSPSHWQRVLEGELLARAPRIDWAQLLRRTFGVDALACPKCGGRLEVLELVTAPDDAAAWLERLGLAAVGTGRPEPRARAPTVRRGGSRAPPAGACVRSP